MMRQEVGGGGGGSTPLNRYGDGVEKGPGKGGFEKGVIPWLLIPTPHDEVYLLLQIFFLSLSHVLCYFFRQ